MWDENKAWTERSPIRTPPLQVEVDLKAAYGLCKLVAGELVLYLSGLNMMVPISLELTGLE